MAYSETLRKQSQLAATAFRASIFIGTVLNVVCMTTFNVRAQNENTQTVDTDAGQRDAPISWISSPDNDSLSYMAQKSTDGKLILSADESFFPKLGLSCVGTGTRKDIAGLNKGESFAAIGKWDTGDIAEWGLFLEQAGRVQFRISYKSPETSGKFELRNGTSATNVTTHQNTETKVITGQLSIAEKGLQTIQLKCKQGGSGCVIFAIELSGPAAMGGAVLRKRWRPAAAHTKFTSSEKHGSIRLWVMEMDAVPGTLPFYSPITTPFGYYGPTWQADGKVNSSFNFSLWSFGRGKESPPIEQLSHLLAAGDPTADLGGFSHEGTGVKIRNWDPLKGRQGQRQALALRVEPGNPYDTYYSYFFANDEKRWRLFGIGNRFNDGKPLKSLWVGSFVEVPGRASVQRTGAYPRTMRYRGWCMDQGGKWHVLNQMATGNIDRKSGFTHTHRGVTDDGWFFLQTGGWALREPPTTPTIEMTRPASRPRFLTDQDIRDLNSTPSSIEFAEDRPSENQRTISFRIRNAGKNPKTTLYYGSKEALTFANQWEHEIRLPKIAEGSNQITVPLMADQQPRYLRLKLTNDEGIFWSGKTFRISQ